MNPTYEDNYPTVNLEAEACGTRVITYDAGGAPETIRNMRSVIVETGNVSRVIEAIARIEVRNNESTLFN